MRRGSTKPSFDGHTPFRRSGRRAGAREKGRGKEVIAKWIAMETVMPDHWTSSAQEYFKTIARERGTFAAWQAGALNYTVYLLLDQERPDPRGHFPGYPIYVGQSGNVPRRMASHCRHAINRDAEATVLHERIAGMMKAGYFPIVLGVASAPTRTMSILAELLRTQDLLRAGYHLCNSLREQKKLLTRDALQRRYASRRWSISLSEARDEGLKIHFHCRACRKAETWDPAMPAEEDFWASNLAGARWRLSPCPSCSCGREATILDPVESAPPPPPPGSRTMNMAKEGGYHA